MKLSITYKKGLCQETEPGFLQPEAAEAGAPQGFPQAAFADLGQDISTQLMNTTTTHSLCATQRVLKLEG